MATIPVASFFQQRLEPLPPFLQAAPQRAGGQMQALGQLLRCRIAVRTQHQQLTHLTQQGITGGHQGTFPLTLGQGLTQRFRIGGRQRAIQPLHRLRRPDTCTCLAITHRHRPVIHGPASGWRLALQPDFRHQGQVRENKLHATGHAAQHGTEQHIAYRSGQHHFRHQLEEQPAALLLYAENDTATPQVPEPLQQTDGFTGTARTHEHIAQAAMGRERHPLPHLQADGRVTGQRGSGRKHLHRFLQGHPPGWVLQQCCRHPRSGQQGLAGNTSLRRYLHKHAHIGHRLAALAGPVRETAPVDQGEGFRQFGHQ